ncbi:MAG: adenine phosphoribosyltransferase [Actinomycetaceae bacterium]|nr:adenine phosphoribosyltransferase [Actinomycetaceae bacterium]
MSSMPLSDKIAPLITENLREIPDFPQKGVLFRDITPLLANGDAFKKLVDILADHYRGRVDAIAGLESRGFILAAPLATALGVGMITIRKAGKLPGPVIGVDYELEYGSARMELRPDSVQDGSRVLIIDDVLATGGTSAAAVELVKQCGGEVVSVCVLLELEALGGRSKLEGVVVESGVVF